MSYDAASFKAGFALGRVLWQPCSVRPLSSPPLLPIVDLSDRSTWTEAVPMTEYAGGYYFYGATGPALLYFLTARSTIMIAPEPGVRRLSFWSISGDPSTASSIETDALSAVAANGLYYFLDTHVADLLPYPPYAAYWLSAESADAALADAKKRFGGST